MLSCRMGLAQNPPSAERAWDLRESQRLPAVAGSLPPACRQAGLCVIRTTLSSSPLRSLAGSHPSHSLAVARPNPPRINTSMKSLFFIKSLIMNDLKSNRINTGDNKPCRINTSERCSWKPFRINTSKGNNLLHSSMRKAYPRRAGVFLDPPGLGRHRMPFGSRTVCERRLGRSV